MFPGPLHLRDCSFDPLHPSVDGLTEHCPGAHHTQERSQDVVLLVPRDCGWGSACPRESSRDFVAAASQGLWQITTHIWHQASPQRPCSSTHECGCSPGSTRALPVRGSTPPLPDVVPAGEPPLPVWPEDSWTPLCFWEFALLTRELPGMELQSFRLWTPSVYSLNGI